MYRFKKIVIVCLLLLRVSYIHAQQEIMVSQYMFNGLFLNPAYAGSHKYFSSSLLYRNQWVGFTGAPKSMLLAVDGPLMDQKMGVGLIVATDKIGATRQSDVYANYSYILPLEKGKLAFGIKAGASQYTYNSGELIVWDANDEKFNGVTQSALIPKFGFGAYYFTERAFAGISVPSMLYYNGSNSFTLPVSKHYYITGGYVMELEERWKLKPSFLFKYQKAAPVQLDMNITAMFMDQVSMGLSYRTGDAVVAILEYQANQRFRIGYAYDFTTSAIRKYATGSHEIMIGFDFGKDIIKTKTPRFF
jgi:type IX secretion system PorP/SprF family membrane protein